MSERLSELFKDKQLVQKIQKRLPYLFQLAELEASRAGKIGMEVGSIREKIIAALLIYKFGETNVKTDIPITRPETDVILFNEPLSIKTFTGLKISGVKLIWTVDAKSAYEFSEHYSPTCDILLVQVNWGGMGGLYYIPKEIQISLFNQVGKEKYIKLPKQGTNPRGVEITKEALSTLVNNAKTYHIDIKWQKTKIHFNPYKRWVDLWKEN